jgi:hypothetical protein
MILTVETRRTGAHCHSAAGANCHSAAVTTATDCPGGERHVHD